MIDRFTGLPSEKLRFVEKIDELRLDEIRAGIIVVRATWSGPSLVRARRLHILNALNLDSLDIVILDHDCMNGAEIKLFGHWLGGCAETFWIRNGKVVGEFSPWSNLTDDEIINNTKNLLENKGFEIPLPIPVILPNGQMDILRYPDDLTTLKMAIQWPLETRFEISFRRCGGDRTQGLRPVL